MRHVNCSGNVVVLRADTVIIKERVPTCAIPGRGGKQDPENEGYKSRDAEGSRSRKNGKVGRGIVGPAVDGPRAQRSGGSGRSSYDDARHSVRADAPPNRDEGEGMEDENGVYDQAMVVDDQEVNDEASADDSENSEDEDEPMEDLQSTEDEDFVPNENEEEDSDQEYRSGRSQNRRIIEEPQGQPMEDTDASEDQSSDEENEDPQEHANSDDLEQENSDDESDEPINPILSDADPSNRPPPDSGWIEASQVEIDTYEEKLRELWLANEGSEDQEIHIPGGYELFRRPRPKDRKTIDRKLWGHPNDKPFSSPIKFYEHMVYLIRSQQGMQEECDCECCDPGEHRRKRALKGKSKKWWL